jgi:hypothetical protein
MLKLALTLKLFASFKSCAEAGKEPAAVSKATRHAIRNGIGTPLERDGKRAHSCKSRQFLSRGFEAAG